MTADFKAVPVTEEDLVEAPMFQVHTHKLDGTVTSHYDVTLTEDQHQYEVPPEEPFDKEKSLKMDQEQIDKENGTFTQKDVWKKNGGGWKMEFMAYKDIKSMSIMVGMHMVNKPTQFAPMGQVAKAMPITLQTIEEEKLYGATEEAPFLRLKYEEAQALMNELWGCGIRPTEVGSHGELGATKAHLEDMRKITFELIGLKK